MGYYPENHRYGTAFFRQTVSLILSALLVAWAASLMRPYLLSSLQSLVLQGLARIPVTGLPSPDWLTEHLVALVWLWATWDLRHAVYLALFVAHRSAGCWGLTKGEVRSQAKTVSRESALSCAEPPELKS